jgi:hypothetical protein
MKLKLKDISRKTIVTGCVRNTVVSYFAGISKDSLKSMFDVLGLKFSSSKTKLALAKELKSYVSSLPISEDEKKYHEYLSESTKDSK